MKKLFTAFFPILFILALLIPKSAFAGGSTDESDIKKNLPKMLGANNVGKEFWFTIPPCFEDESGGFPNFIKIFVTAPIRTLVTVEVPGKGYYKAMNTIANDVIEFNITPSDGQPYVKPGRDPEYAEKVYLGSGIHVTADYPLVVYCVVRYDNTSDGFLAIPVSSLGKEYVVAGYPVDPMFEAVWGYKLPNTSGIVAAYDNTTVKFTMAGNSASKTAGGLIPGQTTTAKLNKGDVWMFSTKGPGSDLSGSKIVATKPVGVVTGNQCNNIPMGNQWCDYTVEMDLPTYTWGKDYHVGKVPGRYYPSLIRIYAKENNTKLYKNGKQIGSLPNAGGVEGKGFVEMRMGPMEFPMKEAPKSAVFSGDKPIGISLYNCGVQEDQTAGKNPNSDPFVMAITPVEQYQKEITFCTPGFQGTGFAENYINLVYETDSLGMCPDDIEFAQVFGGEFKWAKLKAKYAGVDESFTYNVNGKSYALKTITLPGDGVYKIRAKKPFAAYSFGYDSYDSYGFPTSAALADIEKPDTVAPVPVWTMHCGDDIDGATVTDMPNDDSVRSNLSMIVYNSDVSYNYEFSYDPFEAGKDRSTKWKLHVIDLNQDAKAVITFSDRRGNDTTITIQYFATKLTIRPDKVDFGLLKMGDVVKKNFWAINYSTQSPALVSDFKLKMNDQNFVIDNPASIIGQPIPPMDSIKFTVTFTASKSGSFKDSLGIGDTCMFAFKSEIKAAVDEPIIYVDDFDYGKVGVGNSVSHDFQIKNNGAVNLNITGFSGPSNPAVYKVSNLPFMDKNNPLVIAPNKTRIFTVDFQPDAVKTYPDQIVFFSDANKVDSIAILNGEGIMPQLLATNFDWNRKRINRPNFNNDGPYPIVNQYNGIYLENNGNAPIQIDGFTVVTDQNGYAFEFDRTAAMNGFTLNPQERKVIPVNFNPDKVGDFKLVIKWENSFKIEAQSVLEGTGILGRISITDPVDFGTTIVNDFSNIQKKKIVLKNEEYDYQDSVTITDLGMALAGSIATNMTSWGSEGFRYDKSLAGLPLVLQPNDSLVIDAEFVAAKNGANTAAVSTTSDAEQDVTTHWNGDGFSQKITVDGGTVKTCVGTTVEIPVVVKNSGSGDITVNSVSMNPQVASLTFKNPNDASGFVLKAGEPRTIVLVYTPTKAEKATTTVTVNNTSQGSEQITTKVDVESVFYPIKTTVTIDNRNPLVTDLMHVSVNADLNNQDIAMASVHSLDVTLQFRGNFLSVKREDIQVGSALNGKFKIKDGSLVIRPEGQIFLTLEGLTANDILNVSGEILKFTMSTYLPTTTLDSSDVKAIVQATGNACVSIANENNEIKLQPVCAYNLRKVQSFGHEYSLQQISPNPVGSNGTSINFSVGLEAMTEIAIYTSTGELVAKPISQVLKPGAYSVQLSVDGLPSGAYLCKMVSGPFNKTREMVIAK